MKKKVTIMIIIVGLLLLLWFCGIRIHMPFSTIAPKNWETLEIANSVYQRVQVTEKEDIKKVKELLSDLPVTTCGIGHGKDGFGFIIKINSKEYTFAGYWVIPGWRYQIPEEQYSEQLRKQYDEFLEKYGPVNSETQ